MNKYLVAIILFLIPFTTLANDDKATFEENMHKIDLLKERIDARLIVLQKLYPKEYAEITGQTKKDFSHDTERTLN